MHVSANYSNVSNNKLSLSAVSTSFDAVLMGCIIASHCRSVRGTCQAAKATIAQVIRLTGVKSLLKLPPKTCNDIVA